MSTFLYKTIFTEYDYKRFSWCLEHLGPSTEQDPKKGKWYAHNWEGNIEYYFKYEQDALLFRLTWL